MFGAEEDEVGGEGLRYWEVPANPSITLGEGGSGRFCILCFRGVEMFEC